MWRMSLSLSLSLPSHLIPSHPAPFTHRVSSQTGGGSTRYALLGDKLATKAVKNGWNGIIIYGCIRDSDEIRGLCWIVIMIGKRFVVMIRSVALLQNSNLESLLLEMPIGVQALGTIPRKTLKKNRGDKNLPITFGGVTFKPGHFVYADPDGIVVSERMLLKSSL